MSYCDEELLSPASPNLEFREMEEEEEEEY